MGQPWAATPRRRQPRRWIRPGSRRSTVGVRVRVDAIELIGRHGLALARRGAFGTTGLLVNATTYQLLGTNLTTSPKRRADTARGAPRMGHDPAGPCHTW